MRVKEIDVEARWFAGKGRPIRAVAPTASLGALRIARVDYRDGGTELYSLCDDVSWGELLADPPEGLELRGSPPSALAGERERLASLDQTNTLAAIGSRVVVKAYRRLQPGVHPEPELMGALARAGGPVPRVFASLHFGDLVLALVMERVEAEGGWEGPIERVAAALRGEGVEPLDEYRAAGAAARRLHVLLGSLFPTRAGAAVDAAAARASALSALDSVAELGPLGPRVRAELAGLARLEGALLQRIHGDLHYAQFLRRAGRPAEPLVIDFEGDPTRPLAERRAPGSPLHDLACLLRSIDHIGSAASRRADGAAPDAWIAAARGAALEGYGPVSDPELLHALELAKEIGEFVYAQRILPEWLYAARAGLERLLA